MFLCLFLSLQTTCLNCISNYFVENSEELADQTVNDLISQNFNSEEFKENLSVLIKQVEKIKQNNVYLQITNDQVDNYIQQLDFENSKTILLVYFDVMLQSLFTSLKLHKYFEKVFTELTGKAIDKQLWEINSVLLENLHKIQIQLGKQLNIKIYCNFLERKHVLLECLKPINCNVIV